MKKNLYCRFMLVKNGTYGPCGEEAIYRFKNSPLCDECAEYVKGRGETVIPITEEFVKKVRAQEVRKAKNAGGLIA